MTGLEGKRWPTILFDHSQLGQVGFIRDGILLDRSQQHGASFRSIDSLNKNHCFSGMTWGNLFAWIDHAAFTAIKGKYFAISYQMDRS